MIITQKLPCWCGANNWIIIFRASRFGLLQCDSCGVYRLDPIPILQKENVREFYSNYYAQSFSREIKYPNKNQRTSRFWRVVDREAYLGKAEDLVIDIGCGDGILCAELREAGWGKVIGIDISRSRISRAKAIYPHIEFYDCPLRETTVPTGLSDLLIMDNVIEHLIDPGEMIRQLKPYLNQNGRFVIITPNMDSGHFRLLGRLWTPELSPHTHIYLYNSSSLTQLMESEGLTLEHIGSIHLPPYSLKAMMNRIIKGDVKGGLWRCIQEIGGLYGRLIGSGSMLYIVCRQSLDEQMRDND